jgi:diadenosine tetraphosphate (Ap4A) HIT family hydrolase
VSSEPSRSDSGYRVALHPDTAPTTPAASGAQNGWMPDQMKPGRADGCLLCRVTEADAYFQRRRVWTDEHWRLSVVLRGAVAGFAHLEPHRHIPFITDLDGPEAGTLGPVLARVTATLRAATGADKVYVYVFGDRVPHLHFNLAPQPLDGPLVGGAGLIRPDAPALDAAGHEAAADRVAAALAG